MNTSVQKCGYVHDGCVFSYLLALDALILISITLGCTFVNVYAPALDISSSSMSYTAYALTNCYSTPSSSSNSSMYTKSTYVAHGPAYSLKLQPLLRMCKTQLQMFWICIYLDLSCAQIASSHCTLCLLHTLKMMVSMTTTLPPSAKCSTFQHSLLFLNSSFASFFPNSLTSSSCLHMCSLFCVSFSFVILYNFSIAFFALMLM